ncbi:MAG: hypothetical protein RRA92_02020 [Gemmatimonadota bacterium]|nr:hypothetical protein [Gemmatimonadota bacterium]
MAVLIAALAPTAAAQTPITSLGLGYTVPALDARAAALGGSGLGLAGGSLGSANPADLLAFSRLTVGLTFAPEDVEVDGPAGSVNTGRSRVPLLRIVLPRDEWRLALGFTSELDQDWSATFQDTIRTEFGTFPFDERREQDGGVSAVNLAVARNFGPVGLGVEGSIFTGNLRQDFTRSFEPSIEDLTTIATSSGEARFRYTGLRLRGGAVLSPRPGLRLSGLVSVAGDLEVERDTLEGIARPEAEFSMPVEWAVGGSYRATPRLLVNAGLGWAGWSDSADQFAALDADDAWWFGAGVEYTGARLLGLGVPLRGGIRRRDLPFHSAGTSQLRETALTLGAGIAVAEDLARFDLSLELGSRGDLQDSGVEESFTRFSVSITLLQR